MNDIRTTVPKLPAAMERDRRRGCDWCGLVGGRLVYRNGTWRCTNHAGMDVYERVPKEEQR